MRMPTRQTEEWSVTGLPSSREEGGVGATQNTPTPRMPGNWGLRCHIQNDIFLTDLRTAGI